MNPTPLSSLSDSDLSELVGGRPLTVLAGSGVSIWNPTNLPTGVSFSNSIFRAIFDQSPEASADPAFNRLEELYNNIPFESVMEKCPEQEILMQVVREIFDVSQYNPIHEALAGALGEGRVNAIITTNYDCCIDQALADHFNCPIGPLMGEVSRIVRKEEITDDTPREAGVYFKIHGSADDASGESLVFRLSHESTLDERKRSLLRALLAGKTLLILGYSGLDFEICPELPLLQPACILWNIRPGDKITANARRVMGQIPGAIIAGDMVELVSRILVPVEVERGTPSVDVERLFRERFSEAARMLWRARLLNTMCFAGLSGRVCRELLQTAIVGPERAAVMEESARSFHLGGAYRLAALEYEKIAALAESLRMPRAEQCRLLLDACDNWRCHGSFIRAWSRLKAARRLAASVEDDRSRDELEALAELKRLLLLRHLYLLFRKLRLSRLEKRVKVKAGEAIMRAARMLPQTGSWYDYQQLSLWTERFDLSPELTRMPELYEAPPPREGYDHLGLFVAQMMVFRDEVDTGRREPDDDALREALDMLELAGFLNTPPEQWKLRYLLLRRFPQQRSMAIFKQFVKSFWSCQYSLSMRVMLLLVRH